ncbi:MAG: hypothetical protein HY819_08250 [Acidobacteria bacterium]|nr:hypothetical protein [Acidobacteriota bacterium]
MKKLRYAFLAILLAVLFSTQMLTSKAHHAVLQFNLEEMVATADKVFVGKCTNIKETEEMIAQGMMPVTYYTFAVSEKIKGDIPQTFTFKQLGHQPRKFNKNISGKEVMPMVGGVGGRIADPDSFIVHGLSNYHIGEEMLLMLIPNYMGDLTYPVGLYQGAFYITQTSKGKQIVKNSINNRGLFTNPYNNYSKSSDKAKVIHPEGGLEIPIIASRNSNQNFATLIGKPGALPLNDLTGLVRTIAESEK